MKKHPNPYIPRRVSLEEALLAEIEDREALDSGFYYEAKLPSIRRAREIGLSDTQIERMLGITLKPEDRAGAARKQEEA